jgi:uncharacterized membrane protein YeaQ/YmgE (transglycosylase-associated protein family)
MSLLWLLIIGVVAGWIAGHLTRGRGFGLLGDMIVGVIGAWLGSTILEVFGLYSFGFIGSVVTALIGAVVLLTFIRVIKNV